MSLASIRNAGRTLLKLLFRKGYVQSFGQFGEDAVLQKLLQKREGFYIDVGAYHPILYSNTYAFYKRGWSGVVIDANKEHAGVFKMLRPRDTFIHAAVGKPGRKTLYQYSDGAFNQLTTKEPPLPRGVTLVGKTLLDIVPLRDLTPRSHAVDLLTIDVEGLDVEVLETYDWDTPPRVVAIEVHGFDPERGEESPAYAFLRKKGYFLTALCGVTLIFTRKYKRA